MPTERELARLYDDHAPALFAFLLNLTRHEPDTRDLLQDLFIKLARQPELLHAVREERHFLLRLAHNAAIDLMRRRTSREQRNETFSAETFSPFAPTADPDEQAFRNALADSLSDLPPDQRAVVHLKLWAGLTFEEIADTLEIPLNTAARERKGTSESRQASDRRASVLDCGGPPPLSCHAAKRQRAGALQDLADAPRPFVFSVFFRG